MNIDEKVALAFNFADAPVELKQAAELHRANYATLNKATTQSDLWKQKRKDAQLAYNESFEQFQKLAEGWNPSQATEEAGD